MNVENIVNSDKFTVYQIVNSKNGKSYIGVHKTKNINDSYMGSGKLIKSAIQKYGIENFNKKILLIFDNYDDALCAEIQLISDLKPGYNLHEGGNGGWIYVNKSRLWETEKHKAAASKNWLKAAELGRKKAQSKKSIKKRNATIKRRVENGEIKYPFSGMKHSDKTKKIISEKSKISQLGSKNSQFGKKKSKNEIKKISDSLKKYWDKKGRKLKKNISKRKLPIDNDFKKTIQYELSNMSLRKCAKIHNVSPAAISYYVKRHNLK